MFQKYHSRIIKKIDGIKIAFTNPLTLSKVFTNPKDPLSVGEHSNVIYRIPVSEC